MLTWKYLDLHGCTFKMDSLLENVPICGWLMAILWCVTLSRCRGWLLRWSNYFLYGEIGLFWYSPFYWPHHKCHLPSCVHIKLNCSFVCPSKQLGLWQHWKEHLYFTNTVIYNTYFAIGYIIHVIFHLACICKQTVHSFVLQSSWIWGWKDCLYSAN